MDGFEGTNSIVKGLVSAGINQLTSQVYDLLSMVKSIPNQPARKLKSEFPSWVKSEDRNLLQLNDLAADATVAADGTGDFTNVMDAVLAAPDNSMRRYVIYIKRGVYFENVEIKKKKWHLMMIGDGIDSTIISGNRSFIDGWTTFRSATFGNPFILFHFHLGFSGQLTGESISPVVAICYVRNPRGPFHSGKVRFNYEYDSVRTKQRKDPTTYK